MSNIPHYGNCHICGRYCKLSFEHVPPQAAFNDRRVIVAKVNPNKMYLGPDEQIKGKQQQKGAGSYTLCTRCNNLTGSWYAPAFIDWCYQAMMVLQKTNGKPTLIYLYNIFPLRILKQIITMFFSINGDGFQQNCQDLVKFVLNKEARYLPPKYRVFIAYNYGTRIRQIGQSVIAPSIRDSKLITISELSFTPFIYVLTTDSDPPDKRLVDISFMGNYRYNDWKTFNSNLTILETNSMLPGDYRTHDQIQKDYVRNIAYKKKRH